MDKFRFRRRSKEKCFVWRGRFTESCSRFGPPSFRFVNPSWVLRVVRSLFYVGLSRIQHWSRSGKPLKWSLIHVVIFDQSKAGNFPFKKRIFIRKVINLFRLWARQTSPIRSAPNDPEIAIQKFDKHYQTSSHFHISIEEGQNKGKFWKFSAITDHFKA